MADTEQQRLGVVVVTFPSAQILDVTGPLEVFSSATRLLPAAEYRTQVVSTSGGPVLASSGLSFSTTALPDVVEPIDAGVDKVHFKVRFTRCRDDGTPIATFPSFYIVTRVEGRWAIQGRSSWAA